MSQPDTPAPRARIAAVVVTHNRLSLLQECIAAIRAQTRPVDEIIVVNNASTDGTLEWLQQQPDLTVITQDNSGSSGGQYTGIKTAYHNGHDWFWCMDDDTIAKNDALRQLTLTPHFHRAETGSISSVVLWTDGKPWGDSHNTANLCSEWFQSVLSDHCVRTTGATFVGLLVARPAVTAVGLPMRRFFLFRDDSEYTGRIAAQFKCYFALDSQVIHKTQSCGRHSSYDLCGYRGYYWIRNQVVHTRMKNIGVLLAMQELALQFLHIVYGVMRRRLPVKAVAWYLAGFTVKTTIDWP